jgi:hypothetical protein
MNDPHPVTSGDLCVDCHTPGPTGIGAGWGDVDKLSTAYPKGKRRHLAAIRRYPQSPHHYGKHGYLSLQIDKIVWTNVVAGGRQAVAVAPAC